MKISSKLVVTVIGVSVLSGCAATPSMTPATDRPSVSSSEGTQTISPAKEKLSSSGPTSPPSESNLPASPGALERSPVVWTDYQAGLQSSIDQVTAAEDCRGISTFYGLTTATEESVLARTGHGNDALVSYLDEALVIANCG